ncbi:MAG: carbamoyltransferase HypF [Anaerolineales bacterium]|nr:carbamoyltransferase HypF [Anaerolineales bacterium]
MSEVSGVRIHIQGVVQGVGFRPFVFSLAEASSLTGWVRNTSAGVEIEVDGSPNALDTFVASLRTDAPPLARIDSIEVATCEPGLYSDFTILPSKSLADASQPISPDVSLCADCRRELYDPADRRFRYPFINCTNCGPRFTIIQDIPYDRPNTTMAPFEMCTECAAEYHDPRDRRFHAQPVACPDCGPQIWLEDNGVRRADREEALQAARQMITEGKILAVKGLGGFHLACDATNDEAVNELRRRKLRVNKPFAVMVINVDAAGDHCELGETERNLLLSRERPVVIADRKRGSTISDAVAPGQNTIGLMLPYTPLHELLLEQADDFPEALVMTSGNLSEEPIATDNEEARDRLTVLADAFLMNDRDIHTRCDDSVVRAFEGGAYLLRRSRGYAPFPLNLAWESPSILATGPELKNTFCFTKGTYAFLSHHIGDMENYETLQSFEEGIAHFERLFRVTPEAIAYDLHPNYLATRYAIERAERDDLTAIGIQHHHAHIAACMAEHNLPADESVIGVAFDGTGYGEDGAIWGGEVLIAAYGQYERFAHLDYMGMPGGDAAVVKPWRLALAWLHKAGLPWSDDLPPVKAASEEEQRVVARQLEIGLNSPQTSSMGRLFDAVSALIGLRQEVNYEAQAAIELESQADREETGSFQFGIRDDLLDPAPVIRSIVSDLSDGVSVPVISARFHNGVAQVVLEVCTGAREKHGLNRVVLSGGVWQNMFLMRRTVDLLRGDNFEILIHRKVPANDGGLALGQAAIAAHKILTNSVGE